MQEAPHLESSRMKHIANNIRPQFHDKYVNKLSWITEDVVSDAIKGRKNFEHFLTRPSIKSCSVFARPFLVLAAPKCITASIFSTTASSQLY
jgi:hypothetical protein